MYFQNDTHLTRFPNFNLYLLKRGLLSFYDATKVVNRCECLTKKTFGYYKRHYLLKDGIVDPSAVVQIRPIGINLRDYLTPKNLDFDKQSKVDVVMIILILRNKMLLTKTKHFKAYIKQNPITIEDVVSYLLRESDQSPIRKIYLLNDDIRLLFGVKDCTEIKEAMIRRLIELGKWKTTTDSLESS